MKLILFTTRFDKGRLSLQKEAKNASLLCHTYLYEKLEFRKGEIYDLRNNPLSIRKSDKIILRDPYNSKGDYSFLFRKILTKYYRNVVFDKECYIKFPNYEDKWFQRNLFIKLGINTPETYLGKKINSELNFPVIVKPRIGSRSRGIRIIQNEKCMKEFFDKKRWGGYVFQKYHELKNEYRVLLLKHKVLGVADKNVFLKDKGKVGVTINKLIENVPKEILKDSVRVSKKLKADLIGIDVIRATDSKYYFIDLNLSPQFAGFAKATGINVAREVIDRLVNS